VQPPRVGLGENNPEQAGVGELAGLATPSDDVNSAIWPAVDTETYVNNSSAARSRHGTLAAFSY
jgi:hypothetical protein